MDDRRPNEELGLWYLSRAYAQLSEAERYFLAFKYAESVISSHESIEFSLKALCKVLDIQHKPEHFLNAETLAKLAEKIGGKRPNKKDELLSIIPITLSYTKEQRTISRYGVDKPGVPTISPNRMFRKEHSKGVLEDARRLCDLLHDVDMSKRWDKARCVRFGILNGYVEGASDERPCTEHVWRTDKTSFWKDFLSSVTTGDGANRYAVVEINACEISNEYAVILNPFGESYPEYSLRDRQVYNMIKAYIEDGGVFVNTAGFPFFYAWDVHVGGRQPISEERVVLPRDIEIREGTITVKNLQVLLQFTGTLFYREFGALTTYDVESHVGAIPERIYQREDDKRLFGDLIGGIEEVGEFRALREGTKGCIPLIRASCGRFGEVYPIAALGHGRGYLVVGGMHMARETEFQLFARAVDGFCTWMLSRYT